MKVKANVLEKSSFANLVYFLIMKKIVFIPFIIIITLLLALCVCPNLYKKTKGQTSFNFSAIQNLTQFTWKFPVWVCVWGGGLFFSVPLLLVLRIVSEDSKAFPLDTSCMGFSGALLERGSFFISFFISCEDKKKTRLLFEILKWLFGYFKLQLSGNEL